MNPWKRISNQYDFEQISCQICQKKFKLFHNLSLFNRQHKCKLCKRLICHDCGKNKQIVIFLSQIFGYIDKNEHRVCLNCHKDTQFQKNFSNVNKIQWNQNSRKGIKWVKYIQENKLYFYQRDYYNLDCKYLEYLEKNTEMELNQELNLFLLVIQLFQKLLEFEQMNYSINQFMEICQKNVAQGEMENNILNILRAFKQRNQHIVINQSMLFFAFFLVSFLFEDKAFQVLCYIFEQKISMEYFQYTQQLFIRDEIYSFLSEHLKNVNDSQTKLFYVKEFMKQYFEEILNFFLVDFLNLENFLYLFDKILTKDVNKFNQITDFYKSIIIFVINNQSLINHDYISIKNSLIHINLIDSIRYNKVQINIFDNKLQQSILEFEETQSIDLNNFQTNYDSIISTAQRQASILTDKSTGSIFEKQNLQETNKRQFNQILQENRQLKMEKINLENKNMDLENQLRILKNEIEIQKMSYQDNDLRENLITESKIEQIRYEILQDLQISMLQNRHMSMNNDQKEQDLDKIKIMNFSMNDFYNSRFQSTQNNQDMKNTQTKKSILLILVNQIIFEIEKNQKKTQDNFNNNLSQMINIFRKVSEKYDQNENIKQFNYQLQILQKSKDIDDSNNQQQKFIQILEKFIIENMQINELNDIDNPFMDELKRLDKEFVFNAFESTRIE